MKANFDLTGKVAIVTGASRGIGEEIAKTLAAHGAKVVITNKNIEGLPEVEAKIKAAGGEVTAMTCHNGIMADIDRLMKDVEAKYGRLDILVNNAAANFYYGEMIGADETVWDKTMEVNLKGTFFMSQYAMKLMLKSGGGSIINIASVNGIVPAAMQGVYSITKAGVISMTKGFAKELGQKGIRVNAVCPGLTDTKFAAVMVHNDDLMEKELLPRIPMHRAAQPDEMTGVVVFLASEASSFMTGSIVVVDGGQTA